MCLATWFRPVPAWISGFQEGYDDLARISSANCGAAWSQTFTPDPFGNVTKSGSITFTPGFDQTKNWFLPVTGFDNNGNLLTDVHHAYSWDAENKLTAIDTIGLTFDALGRMAEQVNGGAYTQIVYSPTGGKVALMNGQTLRKAFVALPGGGAAVYGSAGTISYYRHADWLGSSRFASTPGRAMYYDVAYAPYGEKYSDTGTQDLDFTGQNQDTASYTYDFLFREYNPNSSRWIQPDPAGLAAVSMTSPQSWNRYAYVSNMPLNGVDLLGLLGPWSDVVGSGRRSILHPGYEYDFNAFLPGALSTIGATWSYQYTSGFGGQANTYTGGDYDGDNSTIYTGNGHWDWVQIASSGATTFLGGGTDVAGGGGVSHPAKKEGLLHRLLCASMLPLQGAAEVTNGTVGLGAGGNFGVLFGYGGSFGGGVQAVADPQGNVGVAISVNFGFVGFGASAMGGAQGSVSTSKNISGLAGWSVGGDVSAGAGPAFDLGGSRSFGSPGAWGWGAKTATLTVGPGVGTKAAVGSVGRTWVPQALSTKCTW
jgi:RHS repeat-associated protein